MGTTLNDLLNLKLVLSVELIQQKKPENVPISLK
jgi:hypothetical protein